MIDCPSLTLDGKNGTLSRPRLQICLPRKKTCAMVLAEDLQRGSMMCISYGKSVMVSLLSKICLLGQEPWQKHPVSDKGSVHTECIISM